MIINPDGTIFHLHLLPSQLTDRIILVGDPGRVNMVAEFFDTKTFEVSSREFHTIGGTYKGKPIMCLSHGIGPDNIDIVINELDALANIDFATREVKPEHRTLTLVRIGTSGALQPELIVGTPVIAAHAIGFDGVKSECSTTMPDATKCVTSTINRLSVTMYTGIRYGQRPT